jgi:TRAP-type C4-dicarboxylate transport system permease small subunit
MSEPTRSRVTETGRALAFVTRVSDRLALLGGAVLVAMALLVTCSVLRRWLTSQPVPGDFELVQIGLSVAVFAFMPWCQLRGANLFVDTFTGRLPDLAQRRLDGCWAAVYAVVAGLIAVMMAVGAVETIRNGTRSMVLGLPIGWPIAVGAILVVWLAIVVAITALRDLRGRGG